MGFRGEILALKSDLALSLTTNGLQIDVTRISVMVSLNEVLGRDASAFDRCYLLAALSQFW